MDGCWRHGRLLPADQHRVAACFLYQDSPALDSPDVAEVFPGARRWSCDVAR